MNRCAIVIAAACALLAGCQTMQPADAVEAAGCVVSAVTGSGATLADRALEYVQQVCAVPAADRAQLLAELSAAAAPARVAIACPAGP